MLSYGWPRHSNWPPAAHAVPSTLEQKRSAPLEGDVDNAIGTMQWLVNDVEGAPCKRRGHGSPLKNSDSSRHDAQHQGDKVFAIPVDGGTLAPESPKLTKRTGHR